MERGKDEFLLFLAFTAMLVMAFLLGNAYFTFLLLVLGIVVVSASYSLVKMKQRSEFGVLTKEVAYVLTFSLFFTFLFMMIFPYIILSESIHSVVALQYMYVAPSLLVFFILLDVFHYVFYGEIKLKHIVLSIVGVIVINLVITGVGVAALNYVFTERISYLHQGQGILLVEFHKTTAGKYSEDLPVFNEIKTYEEKILEEIGEANRGRCLTHDCARTVAVLISQAVHSNVDMGLLLAALKEANDGLTLIDSGEFNFTTLEEYDEYLQQELNAHVTEIEYRIEQRTQDENVLNIINREMTYSDIQYLLGYVGSDPLMGLHGLFIRDKSPSWSIFNYVLMHSDVARELGWLTAKIKLYTTQQAAYPELHLQLYNNRENDESIRSRITRNRIILSQLEKP